MSQATLDDEDLFGEAADELRTDVTEHLDAAEAALPDAESIWEAKADNVLGVLNTLRTTLEVDDAGEHLRQAKKWYALGERAEAFEDTDALEDRISELESTIEQVTDIREAVADVAGTLPALRERLGPAEQQEIPAT